MADSTKLKDMYEMLCIYHLCLVPKGKPYPLSSHSLFSPTKTLATTNLFSVPMDLT